jgi:hypothetical protein
MLQIRSPELKYYTWSPQRASCVHALKVRGGGDIPQGKFLSRRRSTGKSKFRRSNKTSSVHPPYHIRAHNCAQLELRQGIILTFPAPASPTAISFLRISDIMYRSRAKRRPSCVHKKTLVEGKFSRTKNVRGPAKRMVVATT